MKKAPNIILIMTDSQGANVVERYSGQATDTQHLDRMADSGVRFDSAYTTCPLCTPARAGLFTGMYSHQSGAWTNNLALGTNIRHMGQIFTAEGYNTGYIGKWHLDGHDYFGTGICLRVGIQSIGTTALTISTNSPKTRSLCGVVA
ncbi:sulfatase-like hydrolase/transferase [Enterovibrio coralii]|uniref:sulfatase-like hydrolase/transferase n=1 Tax=Enterovibrio coralii TaxID=294935 RepID=UPI000AF243E7|nr:sulfatase-like hydrolase/transferase [Enterovibrio coralii]